MSVFIALLSTTLLFSTQGKAAILSIENADIEYNINSYLNYFEETLPLNFEQLYSNESQWPWQHNDKSEYNFGFQKNAYWFRFSVENLSSQAARYYLELDYPLIDKVDIFITKNQQLRKEIFTGDHRPFSSREVQHKNFVFILDFKPNETQTVYLRLESAGPLIFPLLLRSDKAFFNATQRETSGLILYYGVIFAMIVYNTFMFLSLREKSFFYYVLFASSFLIYQASYNGLAPIYLWPDAPKFSDYSIQLFQSLSAFSIIIFTIRFLKIAEFHSVFYRLMKFLIGWAIFTFIITFFVSYRLSILSSLGCTGTTAIVLLVSSTARLISGYRPARYYVLAFACFFLGVAATALRSFGVLGDQFFTIYGAQIGSALEALLLSIALGDKIRLDQKYKRVKIAKLNQKLSEHIQNIERIVDHKTREIRSIMASIRIGIFMINEKHQIQKDYSQYLLDLTGKASLEGLNGVEVLMENCMLEKDRIQQFYSALQSIFGQPPISFQTNSHLLIREMIRQSNFGEPRIWEIEWQPIENEEGVVEFLLVCVKDVTERRALNLKLSMQEENIAIIAEIMKISEARFQEIMAHTQKLLERCYQKVNQLDEAAFTSIEAIIHTLKGNARSSGLLTLSSRVHEIEDDIKQIKQDNNASYSESLRSSLSALDSMVTKYLNIRSELFSGSESQLQSDAWHNKRQTYIKRLQELNLTDLASLELLRSDLLSDLGASQFFDLELVIQQISEHLDSVAQELRKVLPQIQLHQQQGLKFAHAYKQVLEDCLGHLLSNALAHGIESAAVRTSLGKSPQGQITVSAKTEGEFIAIAFHDDGAGMDLARIRQQAKDQGLIADADSLPAEELAELIFHPGFSTAAELSSIAGRGVGMSAVRETLIEVGGSIQIKLLPGASLRRRFYFEIQLPLSSSNAQSTTLRSA